MYNKKLMEGAILIDILTKLFFLACCSKEIHEIVLVCNVNSILKSGQILEYHGHIFLKWLFIL